MIDNITIEYVDPPQRTEPITESIVTGKEPDDTPKPNRAQRRRLQRYITHKAALNARRIRARNPKLFVAGRGTGQRTQCPRCHMFFLGDSARRCQCQIQQHHECAMCHEDYMASQSERHFANMCSECIEQVRRQWEAEEASRDAAAKRNDELRAWDEEQQRMARERNEE